MKYILSLLIILACLSSSLTSSENKFGMQIDQLHALDQDTAKNIQELSASLSPEKNNQQTQQLEGQFINTLINLLQAKGMSNVQKLNFVEDLQDKTNTLNEKLNDLIAQKLEEHKEILDLESKYNKIMESQQEILKKLKLIENKNIQDNSFAFSDDNYKKAQVSDKKSDLGNKNLFKQVESPSNFLPQNISNGTVKIPAFLPQNITNVTSKIPTFLPQNISQVNSTAQQNASRSIVKDKLKNKNVSSYSQQGAEKYFASQNTSLPYITKQVNQTTNPSYKQDSVNATILNLKPNNNSNKLQEASEITNPYLQPSVFQYNIPISKFTSQTSEIVHGKSNARKNQQYSLSPQIVDSLEQNIQNNANAEKTTLNAQDQTQNQNDQNDQIANNNIQFQQKENQQQAVSSSIPKEIQSVLVQTEEYNDQIPAAVVQNRNQFQPRFLGI